MKLPPYYQPSDIHDIEQAIYFLVNEYQASGQNKKPVVAHSLHLAFYLLGQGYSKDIIVAGILHDLLEDTEVTYQQIVDSFGEHVAKLVASVSFDSGIIDPREQYQELFGRVSDQGKEAFVIKAVDLAMNSQYIHLVTDLNKREELISKSLYFLDLFKKFEHEPVYSLLRNQIEELTKKSV